MTQFEYKEYRVYGDLRFPMRLLVSLPDYITHEAYSTYPGSAGFHTFQLKLDL
jgi:hypothetical protein